jgi:pyrroline-5-carboxylate reductase
MEYTCGFIGYGNMASAIVGGILANGILPAGHICVYDRDSSKTSPLRGIYVCESVGDLAKRADIIFLCVKPNMIPAVAAEIKMDGKAVVSIAAGVRTDDLLSYIPAHGTRVMRIMPNTPLMVGKGATCIQTPNNLLEGEKNFIYNIFSNLGSVEEVDASLMDAVTGVSGSGSAYVYHFIDSLAKAGEANGLDYKQSLALAAQTFEGACAMLKQSDGKSPEQLILDVCSPGGTTIEAMDVFYKKDVTGIIREAVGACVRRSQELSGEK